MSQGTWRPLGIESDEEIAGYDALHDGVPSWMLVPLWEWVRHEIGRTRRAYSSFYATHVNVRMLNETFVEQMCQVLQIPFPNLRRRSSSDESVGRQQIADAVKVLKQHGQPLQIADYILAHQLEANSSELELLLERSKSAWAIGTRAGKPGLVRRVPLGVQVGAEKVMDRASHAGVRLAKAWEALYGIDANPSEAYRLAILAVEDAAIPVVSPTNHRATLGTVLRQIEDQSDWGLPMLREDSRAPSSEVLIGMIRLLWHGQHDRHGGQPSAPGNVSLEEATVAVSLSTSLVQMFAAGLVKLRFSTTSAEKN